MDRSQLKPIDFRSDLLSAPDAAALAAMAAAAQRPPAFGAREDASQRELESRVAELTGFADALFIPTCTMANQIALRLWCSPGEGVATHHASHVATTEAQSVSVLSGAVIEPMNGARGHPSPDEVLAALSMARPETARRTSLVWLENTHNRAGGTIMPTGWARDIGAICHRLSVRLHIDASRIWNAAVGSGQSISALLAGADSASLSLNKGLGAPLGAMLVGDQAFIKEAVRFRHILGGTWRPIGPIAAAALAALDRFPDRIVEDHRRARDFFGMLGADVRGGVVQEPETNLVIIELPSPSAADQFLSALKDNGILVLKHGSHAVRFAFHSGITDADAACAAGGMKQLLRA